MYVCNLQNFLVTRCSLLVVNLLVTSCKIRSLLVKQVARCEICSLLITVIARLKKSLVTRCKIQLVVIA